MNEKVYEKENNNTNKKKLSPIQEFYKKHPTASKAIIGGAAGLLGAGVVLGTTQIKPIREAIEQSDNDVIAGIPGWVDKIPVINEIGDAMNGIVEGVGDVIEDIGSGNTENPGNSQETTEHYEKPTLRDEDEIAETGITAEDILNKLDVYCWEVANVHFNKVLTLNGYSPETELSAQFDKISVPTSYYNSEDYESVKKDLFYYHNEYCPIQIPRSHPDIPSDITFSDVYSFNLHYNFVMVGMPGKNAMVNAVDEDIFEAIADHQDIKAKKINTTRDTNITEWPRKYWIDYEVEVDAEGYEFFEITREDLLNIKDPELLKRLDEFVNATIDNGRKLYPERFIQNPELSKPYETSERSYN